MEYRQLGRTRIRVPVLGLGTVKLGRTTDVKYVETYGLPTDAEVEELLQTAARLGVGLLDTAPAYGVSEERLGRVIGGGGDPALADCLICTKFGEQYTAETGSAFDFSLTALQASVRQSLKRLRRDRIDILLLHLPDNDVEVLQRVLELSTVAYLRRLWETGVIGAVGASTKTVEAGILATQLCDVVMVTPDQVEVLDAAQHRRCGVLLKKVLQQGRSQDPVAAVREALRHPAVSSVIVGTVSPRHLEELAKATQMH